MKNYTPELAIKNIAAYHFFTINNISVIRDELLEKCKKSRLKGTILLANEGINIMLSGKENAIERFKTFLIEYLPALADMPIKESISTFIPFKRIKVKIRPAVIPLRGANTNPAKNPAPYIRPTDLKSKLDAGEDIVLLDTRNDYEIAFGTFQNAIDLNITEFDDFTEATKTQLTEYKNKTIVTFCTGGIRCEKAAPFLIEQGFTDVYQLEGGILNYFEQCEDAHYQGKCFVFDEREAIDSQLGQ